jgi:hypothetical protein
MARIAELPVPSAVETERVLLGTILIDANQLIPVVEILPPGQGSWFYQEGRAPPHLRCNADAHGAQ